MAIVLLQMWGGLGYLINKILFSRAERCGCQAKKRLFQIWSWLFYLFGLPAWIIVFIAERNWIVAAVEFGSAPSMFVGLIVALKGKKNKPVFLDHLAKIFIVGGIVLSIYDAGGFDQLSQFLELGIASCFLMGTYLLANDNSYGYFWIFLGNICAALLMGVQGYYILVIQQIMSLIFVADAYLARRKRNGAKAVMKGENI